MTVRTLAAVTAAVSAGLLAFEVSLMRILLIAGWHHFAFVVIAVALLGFGASGSALVVFRRRLLDWGARGLWVLVLATAWLMPVCVAAAQWIPVEARIAPQNLAAQAFNWVVYWTVLGCPFFTGAAAIGLALMLAGGQVDRVYAANMLGSAVGSAVAVVAMLLLPSERLPLVSGGLTLAAALLLPGRSAARRAAAIFGMLAVGLGCLSVLPQHIRLDPYKYGAAVARLVGQGQADLVASRHGPRGQIAAYDGPLFHDMPFLSPGAFPPTLTVLLCDGHLAGSLIHATHPSQAEVMQHTLMAVPYRLIPERPRVLLLGETGGGNIWLAVRAQAELIDVVQPNRHWIDLLRGPLRDRGGAVFEQPGVRVTVGEPRHFVDHGRTRYDLIQLAALESSAAGSGGVAGLGQDHLMTAEGLTACLRRASETGVVAITRGIQEPPRDNIKVFATLLDALRRCGVQRPSDHVVIVRDFLAVCTLARPTPWTAADIRALRALIQDRHLTPVWFPGIRPEELNHPDVFATPPGGIGDWYHEAFIRLSGPAAESFFDDWLLYVRPATDDQPFFHDFFKFSAIPRFREVFGDLWLTRSELAFLFVLAAGGIIGCAALLLTLVPLAVNRTVRRLPGRGWVSAFCAAVGLAYLFLELTFLSRLTAWIGDPVSAAAATLSGFLLFSGLGGLAVRRVARHLGGVAGVVLLLLLLGVLQPAVLPAVGRWVGGGPLWFRTAAALAAVAPVSFLMGMIMPLALRRLERGAAALIPWAWAVNGFASVLAAPLATGLGMTWGFGAVGMLAVLLYGIAGGLLGQLPGGGRSRSDPEAAGSWSTRSSWPSLPRNNSSSVY